MIVNRETLLAAAPIRSMLGEKHRAYGVSHGLSEAGYDVRIQQDITLHPFRKFALASTMEHFRMPSDLIGVVHDKSTWARRGLSVFNTVIESGWHGFLTLELVYHGWWPLRIEAGSGIAQVLFHRTTDRCNYEGKYQGQAARPIPAILS